MNPNGFLLNGPEHSNWHQPEYYETFLVGKFLPGDAQQLAVRSEDGIVAYKWNTTKNDFERLPDPAKGQHFSDHSGWNQEKYYLGIRTADIDNDGIDEIIGRGTHGLTALAYSNQQGWSILAEPSGLLPDSVAGEPQNYETITWGKFRSVGGDALAIHTQQGVQLIAWDVDRKEWVKYTPDSQTILSGDIETLHGLSRSFRAADIDGDGQDELHLNHELLGGLQTYRFPKGKDTVSDWDLLNVGNKQSDLTLPAAPATIWFGDVNGDGWQDVIGRTTLGIETYFYDPASKRWEQNLSCGFPEFKGGEGYAYESGNKLRFAGATTFRDEYNDVKNNESNWQWLHDQTQRPDDKDTRYTQQDWDAVRTQLMQESAWATSALAVFEDQRKTFKEQYTSEWESTDTVGNELIKLAEKDPSVFNIEFVLETLLEIGIDFATEGLAEVAFENKAFQKVLLSGIGDLIGSASDAALHGAFPDEKKNNTVAKLKDQLVDKRQRALKDLEDWAGEVTGTSGTDGKQGDIGTMSAVGLMHQRNYWPANFTDADFVADKGRWAFKLWLYQQILTSLYDIYIYDCSLVLGDTSCPKPTNSTATRVCVNAIDRTINEESDCESASALKDGYVWVYRAVRIKDSDPTFAQFLPSEVIETLTGALSRDCKVDGGYKVDSCNLSIDGEDLLWNQNGWAFGIANTSSYLDNNDMIKANLSCGGVDATIVGTVGPDVIEGTEGDDVIVALEGDDVVYALGGNDVVCSGDGNDIVYGGMGKDLLVLGDGDDEAHGGKGNDTIHGEIGHDTILGHRGDDIMFGGYGDDLLMGGGGYDIAHGGHDEDDDRCLANEETSCSSEEFRR
ncbi:MAG: calcium-binding protein [bacterium]